MAHNQFICFGEIVWDLFPDGRSLGGAPLNFAYYLKVSGGSPTLVSSVGKDKLGYEAMGKIKDLGLESPYISQVDKPTGTVNILFHNNKYSFEIERGVAWEEISFPNESTLQEAGVYYGTLSRVS